MTKDEALRLALKTLEYAGPSWIEARQPAITAIKAALEAKDEPVGQLQEDAFGRGQVVWFDKPADQSMLYTIPPQRTWVGLTRMELIKCGVLPYGMSYELYEAIEQALKERNT